MKIIDSLLKVPGLWNISQLIFGCDEKKKRVYRSVFKGRGRLLDFGCADGNTFTGFSDFEYYGVDTDAALIDYARRKYSAYHNATFIHANILDRPFEENFFDYVLCAMTGHHLTDDELFPIMKELSRILKVGGSLHYFDTIKKPGRDSALLRILIDLDRGKHMRDEARYRTLLPLFSTELQPVETRVFDVTGTLMPQPTYFYTEFRKI